MARKCKTGIDYFSHDVDIMQDRKIKLLKAKHGLVGYATYMRLLEEVYREDGYYLKIDDDFNILFSDDNNLTYDVYILILNDCINGELFNKKMYDKYSILTSSRIQENYCAATERRKEVYFIKEYLIIDVTSKYKADKVNVCINPLDVNINQLNADIGTQSKVKGKERESKEEENNNYKSNQDIAVVAKFYEEHIGNTISSIIAQELINWLQIFNKDIMCEAIRIAVLSNARSFKYIQSILSNWQSKGVKTLGDVQVLQERRNKSSNTDDKYDFDTMDVIKDL